jgi:ABC-2 type transport system permease protein
MPIFDQGYQHWNGRLSGHAWRWLAITREGVRTQLRKKGTKWTVISAFTPSLILAGALVLWGLLEQGSTLLEPFQFILEVLPASLREGPKAYRAAYWTMAFDVFFRMQTFFAMILVAVVGPDLISQDLRFNAMPLYLSRPLRRIDYFLGKLGVIAAFLGVVTIAPVLVAYALGVAFSYELSVLRDTLPILLGAIAYCAIIIVSAGTLMLAISSLTRNSRFVAAFWVGLWVVSGIASNVLTQTVQQDWCPAVSYTRDLHRVRESLLGTPAARDDFLKLVKEARETAIRAGRMAAGPFGPFGGGRRGRRGGPFGPPPPPPIESVEDMPPPEILLLESDRFPPGREGLLWSSGVLAGLFGLSVLTLTTRVRSLDRLR